MPATKTLWTFRHTSKLYFNKTVLGNEYRNASRTNKNLSLTLNQPHGLFYFKRAPRLKKIGSPWFRVFLILLHLSLLQQFAPLSTQIRILRMDSDVVNWRHLIGIGNNPDLVGWLVSRTWLLVPEWQVERIQRALLRTATRSVVSVIPIQMRGGGGGQWVVVSHFRAQRHNSRDRSGTTVIWIHYIGRLTRLKIQRWKLRNIDFIRGQLCF